MIVADASVVIDYLLGAGSAAGDALARAFVDREIVAAPHLVDVEVVQVLRRFAMRGDLPEDRAVELVDELIQLPIQRYPAGSLLPRAFELHRKVTVSDAVYLALAEWLACPLVTADAALRDVPGATAEVRVLGAAC